MPVDTFSVLAEPTRRRILDQLRLRDCSVSELVDLLAVSQPTMSKHLRVLRDTGFVSCRAAAQRRVYRIEPRQLEALDEWLAPYRRLWTTHLDALERHLDRAASDESEQPDQHGQHGQPKQPDQGDEEA